jgi:hypothetical protein
MMFTLILTIILIILQTRSVLAKHNPALSHLQKSEDSAFMLNRRALFCLLQNGQTFLFSKSVLADLYLH